MKILITTIFWSDGHENSTRIRNTEYVYSELKKLNFFLKTKGVDSILKIYDFSPKKYIEDAIHYPFELGIFQKSKKLNFVLNENNDIDYIFFFDSDTFFLEKEYEEIYTVVSNLSNGEIFTFDLAKLDQNSTEKFLSGENLDLLNCEWSYAYSGEKSKGPLCCGMKGGLGGVFLCDINLLKFTGGFDEKYKFWGGEDGDALEKIISSKMNYKLVPIRKFAPFHLHHFTDWGNNKYYNRN